MKEEEKSSFIFKKHLTTISHYDKLYLEDEKRGRGESLPN